MAQDFNLNVHHVVAESTALGATYYANHIFSVQMPEDTDNGCICARGDYLGDEYYAYEDYAAGKEPMLVLAPPIFAFTDLKAYQNEDRFYNQANDVVRCYVLGVGDRFSISENGFDTAPTEGQYVTFDPSTKLYTVSSSADHSQFCAKVLTRIPRNQLIMYKLVVESV